MSLGCCDYRLHYGILLHEFTAYRESYHPFDDLLCIRRDHYDDPILGYLLAPKLAMAREVSAGYQSDEHFLDGLRDACVGVCVRYSCSDPALLDQRNVLLYHGVDHCVSLCVLTLVASKVAMGRRKDLERHGPVFAGWIHINGLHGSHTNDVLFPSQR